MKSRHISSKELSIAILSVVGIVIHLVSEAAKLPYPYRVGPLLVVLIVGGTPLLIDLVKKAFRAEFGSDLLAGISIVTALALDQYLAGAFVVLMLSGGEALERYASRRASKVLEALSKRMPSTAHKRNGETLVDIAIEEISIGDNLVIFPQEICPVDGIVIEGRGTMDEAFLTGEPYNISKVTGAGVISGAVNGENALVIRATKKAQDSRYAKIAQVMKDAQQKKFALRRLGDELGAWYTPIAVALACASWWWSGEAVRFLAVLVVATPCPLLIAIPVALIGGISLSASRGIIVRDPAALERIQKCKTIILDKTGTLTYGVPVLTEVVALGAMKEGDALKTAATIERYSKHPLAVAIVNAANEKGLPLLEAKEVHQKPGAGLVGSIDDDEVIITSRKVLTSAGLAEAELLPESQAGLECILVVNKKPMALFRFRDKPRQDSGLFIKHLEDKHEFRKVMIVSGDRESEVRYLAEEVGVKELFAERTPEEKVRIVESETLKGDTLFIGDGINDAPALLSATVGVALGHQSDITSEAAAVVIMEASLERVDELFHIARRMRMIALQSAVGGMALSIVGMIVASAGFLPPVAGAVCQELIDLLAVLNALRSSYYPGALTDYR